MGKLKVEFLNERCQGCIKVEGCNEAAMQSRETLCDLFGKEQRILTAQALKEAFVNKYPHLESSFAEDMTEEEIRQHITSMEAAMEVATKEDEEREAAWQAVMEEMYLVKRTETLERLTIAEATNLVSRGVCTNFLITVEVSARVCDICGMQAFAVGSHKCAFCGMNHKDVTVKDHYNEHYVSLQDLIDYDADNDKHIVGITAAIKKPYVSCKEDCSNCTIVDWCYADGL